MVLVSVLTLGHGQNGPKYVGSLIKQLDNPDVNVFSWFAVVIGIDVHGTLKTLQGYKISVI